MQNTSQIKILNETGFAKTMLMPGDPLRAKMIADTYLENSVLVNNVRGIQGYTGFYKGKPISVMASGMGIPSIGIYSYELYTFFGVENIIRIGTAGGLSDNINLRDIVLGIAANTDSNFASQFEVNGTIAPVCSFELLSLATKVASENNISVCVGSLYTTDSFYNYDISANKKWADLGSVAVEMEAAGLYLNAIRCKKKALCICTITDMPLSPDKIQCSVEERESGLNKMIELALETAIRL